MRVQASTCVTDHMQLLNDWRTTVVREARRTYVQARTAKTLRDEPSATTCLDCHSNKAEFCDKCHNYAGSQYARTAGIATSIPKEK